jgi:hypothetical protein
MRTSSSVGHCTCEYSCWFKQDHLPLLVAETSLDRLGVKICSFTRYLPLQVPNFNNFSLQALCSLMGTQMTPYHQTILVQPGFDHIPSQTNLLFPPPAITPAICQQMQALPVEFIDRSLSPMVLSSLINALETLKRVGPTDVACSPWLQGRNVSTIPNSSFPTRLNSSVSNCSPTDALHQNVQCMPHLNSSDSGNLPTAHRSAPLELNTMPPPSDDDSETAQYMKAFVQLRQQV